MEINKPMTTRNMLASTLTDYKKPVKLPKITVELDPHAQETVQGRGRATRHHHPRHAHGMDRMRLPSPRRGGRKGRGEARRKIEAGGQNLVKRYIVPGSPLHERLKGVPRVRLAPTRSRYVQVDKAGPGFLTLDFLLYARRIEWDGQHMNETFRLRGLLGRDDGQQAFDDLTLDVDQDWLSHTADAQPGRDGRLLDIARETLR